MNRARNNGRVGGATDNGIMNGNTNGNMNGDTNGRMNGINGNMNGMNGGMNSNMNGTNRNNVNGNMNGTNRNNVNGNMNGNMNGTQNGRVGGAMLRGDLAEQIRALTFVAKELELYLDTQPRCLTALDYYYQTLAELKRLKDQYHNTVGPLTSAGVTDTEMWTWVNGPWPWQMAGDCMREGDR